MLLKLYPSNVTRTHRDILVCEINTEVKSLNIRLVIKIYTVSYLGKVWNRFDAKTLEDEAKGLYSHGVMLRETVVLENSHQRVNGNGGIEILQASPRAHGHQQFIGSITNSCTHVNNSKHTCS